MLVAIKEGAKKGLKVTWDLTKILVPVYFIVTFLKHTPVILWIADFLSPVIEFVGLSGEGGIVLILGIFINIYASMAAIVALGIGRREVIIITGVLMFCHSLIIEGAIAKRTGASLTVVTIVRIVMGVVSGFTLNMILP